MTPDVTTRQHNSPLLGDLKDFQERPLDMLLDIAANYGPLCQIRFGPVSQLVITDPDGARHVLQSNSRAYIKDQLFMNVARGVLLSGNDLFTSDGDPWLKRRRLMQPAFHRKMIAQFGETIVAAANRTAAEWELGKAVDMEGAMMDATMEAIGRTMLSRNILDDHPQLYDAFEITSGQVIDRATNFTHRLTPAWLPTSRNRAFKQALATIRAILGGAVCERQAQPAAERPHDLLTLLLAGRDDDSGFTLNTEQLMDELYGIVTAGHETTAVTLAWLFYELAQNPPIAAKLRGELVSVLGGRQAIPADLPNLPYLEAVINEALRRYPAAYVTTRQAAAADSVLGQPVPKGRSIMLNIYGLHHHAAYWREPMRFDPARWGRDEINKDAFLPFGAGPRKCIGELLARLEMGLIVATLVPRFHFEVDDARPSELIARFTLRSRAGVWLVPTAA